MTQKKGSEIDTGEIYHSQTAAFMANDMYTRSDRWVGGPGNKNLGPMHQVKTMKRDSDGRYMKNERMPPS